MLKDKINVKNETIDRKIIHISSKRQITIPAKYYEALGFRDEIECIYTKGMLILTPVINNDTNFAEEILADLIKQGYSGETLLRKFREMSKKIRPAVEELIEEADKLAKSNSVNYKDLTNEIFYVNESDE